MDLRLKRKIELVLFVGIIASTAIIFVLFRSTSISFEDELARSADFDITTWTEYRSVEYDVSLRYPERWGVVVSEDALNPMIRVFAPGEVSDGSSLGVLASESAQVSVFPKGIPSVFQTELPATYSLFEQAVRASVRHQTPFMLRDRTRFAEIHRYARTPASWSPSGFVWSQGYAGGIKTECQAIAPAVSVGERRCDLLFGDTVEYTGTTRAFDIELVDAIVDSIRFYGNLQAELATTSLATITEPSPDAIVRNPMTVRGSAPAAWFFEGELPIRLLDANGVVLVETSAHGAFDQGAPQDVVSFTATLRYNRPDTRAGTLIVQKANPSGAPQLSDQVRVPVIF